MFRSVLVVCVGNICRSPMGEALLKKYCQDKGLAVNVGSAGIGALVSQPADAQVIALMEKRCLDVRAHRARQLDADMASHHDLILVMETGHIQAVLQIAPQARGRVHLLGKWNENEEISDPYQKPEAYFVAALSAIDRNVKLWGKYL